MPGPRDTRGFAAADRGLAPWLAAAALAASMSSCAPPSKPPPAVAAIEHARVTMMGTEVNVTAVADDADVAKAAIKACLERMRGLERLLSWRLADSDVTHCNDRAAREPVEVAPETYEVLGHAIKFSQMTHGAFDVTVKPLVQLWKEAGSRQKPPTPEELAQAREAVGYEKIFLLPDLRAVRFHHPDTKIDLGAIAKGYIVDRGLEALRKAGATAGLVVAGGDLATFGRRPGAGIWRVGIQDPRKPESTENIVDIINFNDMACATSGNYRRYVEIGGKRYSHVVNPRTGLTEDAVPSVTVIAPNATMADALATGLSVLGIEEGLKIIAGRQEVQALFLSIEDGRIKMHESPGFAKYRAAPGKAGK